MAHPGSQTCSGKLKNPPQPRGPVEVLISHPPSNRTAINVAALIPAYNPPPTFPDLIRQLHGLGFTSIVVVDDGSSEAHQHLFTEIAAQLPVVVLRHATNLGKGAALKTGLNYCFCNFPHCLGTVTLDADGQHLPQDAAKIAQALLVNPDKLVLGVRTFSGDNIPARSRLGNAITKTLFRALIGTYLQDTQTGLRGIPNDIVPDLLKLTSSGYEFEIDMLLACRHAGRQFIQEPISTVYLEGNKTSHFNPIIDSMRIYFVLFRFALTSLITALIDYSVFIIGITIGAGPAISHTLARIVAMAFNYSTVKHRVFSSKEKNSKTFPKYLALVFFSGLFSYSMITFFMALGVFNIVTAKIIAELIIFIANFTIQRDFIFHSESRSSHTDWARYYQKPYKTSSLTRRLTAKKLHKIMLRYRHSHSFSLAEFGGANSCFLDGIEKQLCPSVYHIIDNCQEGLAKLESRIGNNNSRIHIHNQNILDLNCDFSVDMAFSVGLIEHFDVDGTAKAIQSHFDLLKPDGTAIFFFPTPTILYRMIRWIAEALGLWIFHDERPLSCEEVLPTVAKHARILENRLHASALLTQQIIVARKY